MKRFTLLILTAALLFVFACNSIAATIGYIEVKKIFTEYKETQKAQKDLDKKQKEFKAKLDEKQEDIEKAKEEGKSEIEIRKMMRDIEKELDPEREAIMMHNEQMTRKLQDDIVKSVTAVSKELGIDVVVDKQVIITGGVDITDMVLTKLNK
jgi:outer membrane protein